MRSKRFYFFSALNDAVRGNQEQLNGHYSHT